MGILTSAAYREGKTAIVPLIAYYDEAVKRLDTFIKAYRAQWFQKCKPFGWEVQELRLGGVRARILGCKAHLQAYINGEIDCIEELDAEVLPSQMEMDLRIICIKNSSALVKFNRGALEKINTLVFF